MSCVNVQSKSSASRKPLFDKLCANKKDTSLLLQSCKAFLENPKKNPLTGKSISQGKDVHSFFTDLCKEDEKEMAKEASKEAKASKKAAKVAKATKAAKAAPAAVTKAQIALEEVIEQKIETYLSALDRYYTKRWGNGSAPKDGVSPVNWFTHVRNIESHVSREYDKWVASGNEPVREFAMQHMEPSAVPHHATINTYVSDLYEAAQAFFNVHERMQIEDLDALFKAIKDKHMAKLSQYPSVHEERLERKRFVAQIEKLESEFKKVFTSDKDKKDVLWVKTEFSGLLRQSDVRLREFAERVFNQALEVAIGKGYITLNDLEHAFKVGRRQMF